MSKNAVTLNIGGIKCDSCSYKDMSVAFAEYKEWVNKPCPECGENLLTEADYKNALFLIALEEKANEIFPKVSGKGDSVKVSVEMDGSGKMTFVPKEQSLKSVKKGKPYDES